MGIFWSCCEDNEEVCHRCSRRGLQLTNNECQFCRNSRLATHIRSLQVERQSVNDTRSYRFHEVPQYVPRSTRDARPPARVVRPQPAPVIPKKEEPKRPLYGQFRCSCGRKWNSRRSWQNNYQICKSCHKQVHPHTQRELRIDDIEERSRAAAMEDHPQELCEMCKELGYYCGKYKP